MHFCRHLHIFKNTQIHTNDKETGARDITGMLATSPRRDAKQNPIKPADTTELIPTQSGQEIDFFIKPPQWLVLPAYPRHIHCSTSQPDLKKIQTTGCLPKWRVEWSKLPATVKIYCHGGNPPPWKLKASASACHPIQTTSKAERRYTLTLALVFTPSRPPYDKAFLWVRHMTRSPHDEQSLIFNQVKSPEDMASSITSLHDEHKLITFR